MYPIILVQLKRQLRSTKSALLYEVQIMSTDSNKLLVFPSAFSVQQLAVKNNKLTEELESMKCSENSMQVITEAGLRIAATDFRKYEKDQQTT